jgi:hypothetical protein
MPARWERSRTSRRCEESLNAFGLTCRRSNASLQRWNLIPQQRRTVQRLERQGWYVVVVSNGCGWYIERLFRQHHLRLELHTNPGEYSAVHGLQMQLPTQSPFFDRAIRNLQDCRCTERLAILQRRRVCGGWSSGSGTCVDGPARAAICERMARNGTQVARRNISAFFDTVGDFRETVRG